MMTTTNRKLAIKAGGDRRIKAVIFDMGGVLISAPKTAWEKLERQLGLQKGSLLETLFDKECASMFFGLERGQVTIEEFEPMFERVYAEKVRNAFLYSFREIYERGGRSV